MAERSSIQVQEKIVLSSQLELYSEYKIRIKYVQGQMDVHLKSTRYSGSFNESSKANFNKLLSLDFLAIFKSLSRSDR